jgi:lactate dehydrogenase-like 2-hydroxyacid dehydrogenase
MKKKCLILNNREALSKEALPDLEEFVDLSLEQADPKRFSLDQVINRNSDAQLLVTTYMDLNAKVLEKLPKLEAIITTTISTHFVDSSYCEERGIKIFNSKNYTGTSVAEHAVALMMATMRKITFIDSEVRKGNNNCFEHRGTELFQKTAGIIGFGNIGSSIARLLSGFSMPIQYYNRSDKTSSLAEKVSLNKLLESSDVVFLSLPLNHHSHHLINKKSLTVMKESSVLINISPDEVMDIRAVKQALLNDDISGAGLDLLETEYFLNTPNTVLTPRRAWYTEECFVRRIEMWKTILLDYVKGENQQDSSYSDHVPI